MKGAFSRVPEKKKRDMKELTVSIDRPSIRPSSVLMFLPPLGAMATHI
jgi:hypothetical protein